MKGTRASESAAVAAHAGIAEARQVVLGAGADHHIGLGNHRHIAFAVGGQLIAAADLLARPRQSREHRAGGRSPRRRARWSQAPDAHEAAEGAVMTDEGIGDRADHAGAARAEGCDRRMSCRKMTLG